MDKIARTEPQHREAIQALRPRVEVAFIGRSFWKPFARDAHTAEIARLSAWLEGTGRVVEDQFARRGLRGTRPPDTPLSTSPMDGLLHPIRNALHPRRYGLKNQERTNRLLMLMHLHANRQDDQQVYAMDIRAWLQANNGRPRAARRAITDDRDQPSLR